MTPVSINVENDDNTIASKLKLKLSLLNKKKVLLLQQLLIIIIKFLGDSFDEDIDDEDKDKTYEPPATEIIYNSTKTSSVSNSTPKPNYHVKVSTNLSIHQNFEEKSKPLTRKRLRNENNWGKNIQKKLKNEGKE